MRCGVGGQHALPTFCPGVPGAHKRRGESPIRSSCFDNLTASQSNHIERRFFSSGRGTGSFELLKLFNDHFAPIDHPCARYRAAFRLTQAGTPTSCNSGRKKVYHCAIARSYISTATMRGPRRTKIFVGASSKHQ